MRFPVRSSSVSAEGDMTPMIDMTFQLIAFFMVLINFTEAEQNERIKLPSSQLAKPPEAPLEYPLTLQLTDKRTVYFGGVEYEAAALPRLLQNERDVLVAKGESTALATVIIRADQEAQTGEVQELIEICQQTGFESFRLRAKQEEARNTP